MRNWWIYESDLPWPNLFPILLFFTEIVQKLAGAHTEKSWMRPGKCSVKKDTFQYMMRTGCRLTVHLGGSAPWHCGKAAPCPRGQTGACETLLRLRAVKIQRQMFVNFVVLSFWSWTWSLQKKKKCEDGLSHVSEYEGSWCWIHLLHNSTWVNLSKIVVPVQYYHNNAQAYLCGL